MTTGTAAGTLPLPKGWRKITRAGVLRDLRLGDGNDLGMEQGEPVFTGTRVG